jgi:hypothetical protein
MRATTGWLIALALAPPACSGAGGEVLAGDAIAQMCRAYCEQQRDCFAAEFAAAYESLDGCRAACEESAGAFYDDYYQPECVDAALAKDTCSAGLSCEQLAAQDYTACQDEFDALQECLGHTDGGA